MAAAFQASISGRFYVSTEGKASLTLRVFVSIRVNRIPKKWIFRLDLDSNPPVDEIGQDRHSICANS